MTFLYLPSVRPLTFPFTDLPLTDFGKQEITITMYKSNTSVNIINEFYNILSLIKIDYDLVCQLGNKIYKYYIFENWHDEGGKYKIDRLCSRYICFTR